MHPRTGAHIYGNEQAVFAKTYVVMSPRSHSSATLMYSWAAARLKRGALPGPMWPQSKCADYIGSLPSPRSVDVQDLSVVQEMWATTIAGCKSLGLSLPKLHKANTVHELICQAKAATCKLVGSTKGDRAVPLVKERAKRTARGYFVCCRQTQTTHDCKAPKHCDV